MSFIERCEYLFFGNFRNPILEQVHSSGKSSHIYHSSFINWLKYDLWISIYEWMQTIVFVGVFYLACTVFLVEGYQIPSSSMEPTFIGHPNIFVGDRIFALKGIFRFFPPKRGDIIIFVSAEDQETFIVKRLVGMPGETIEIKHGKIYINGSKTPLEDPPIFKHLEYWLPRTGFDRMLMSKSKYGELSEKYYKVPITTWKTVYDKENPDKDIAEHGHRMDRARLCFGQHYEYYDFIQGFNLEKFLREDLIPLDCYLKKYFRKNQNYAYQIPSDCYFVMGDNSRHSHDSRYWGALPMRNVFGKACLIWWPIKHSEILHSGLPTKEFLNAKKPVRYEDD